jgi:hypothetical protein
LTAHTFFTWLCEIIVIVISAKLLPSNMQP